MTGHWDMQGMCSCGDSSNKGLYNNSCTLQRPVIYAQWHQRLLEMGSNPPLLRSPSLIRTRHPVHVPSQANTSAQVSGGHPPGPSVGPNQFVMMVLTNTAVKDMGETWTAHFHHNLSFFYPFSSLLSVDPARSSPNEAPV